MKLEIDLNKLTLDELKNVISIAEKSKKEFLVEKNIEEERIEVKKYASKDRSKKFYNNNIVWSSVDDSYVLKMRDKQDMSFMKISKILGRTKGAVTSRYYMLKNKNKVITEADKSKRLMNKWTESEKDYLKKNFNMNNRTESVKSISQYLGRSRSAILNKLKYDGLM